MFNNNRKELSYIIGFLQGDGNHSSNTRNRGRISIEISERDIDILLKIKTILASEVSCTLASRTRDTNFKDGYESVILNIFDRKFRDYILAYVPDIPKSNLISPPLELEGYSKYDYLRGLYDADGSLGITATNRVFISFCTNSEGIKEYILNTIQSELGLIRLISRNTRDNIYNICLYDEDAVRFANLLYTGSSICLDRKFIKYHELLNWVRSVPKRQYHSQRWSKEEDSYILLKDITLEEKMAKLNRTDKSIKMRLWRLRNKVTT